MRLRTQFLISLIGFVFILIIIISSVALTNLRIAELHSQRDTASEIEIKATTLSYISINYFLYQENSSDWQATVTQLYSDISRLNSTNPQQQNLVNEVLIDLKGANDTFHNAMSALNGIPLNQTSGGIAMFEDLWNSTSSRIQHLSIDSEELSRWIDRQSNQTNQTNIILIITLIGLFGAFFFLMYQLVFKRTLRSIVDLRAKTKKISQGNLNYPSQKYRHDEIGELSTDVDNMVSNLKQTTASKEELEKEVAERKKAQAALLEVQTQLKDYATNLEKIVEERTKKILESEQNYRELYDSFGEAFIAADWESNIIHWNKAAERVTTVKAQDALGKKIYEVLPEMMSADKTPYFETLQKKHAARFMKNTVSRETGRPAIFEISTYPSSQGIIIIVEDKTEEEQNKRLLAIGQTAGMVGHDIRNPLQAITSDLYLIREELKDVPACQERQGIQESLKTIEENIFYINKIVSDLQDYTRPLAPQKKEIKIRQTLQGILSTINIPPNIEVKTNASNDLSVNTDESYLKRILSNLIINAIQAMPEGGKLTLQALQKESRVQMTVEDTGTGIPKEASDKIFTPLFTTKSKGQGLGLAVVKRLAEGVGGNIAFESQEGKGTKFTLELPM